MTTLHADRYHFHVRGVGGGHSLQLARLQNGYTLDQAQQDFQKLNSDVPDVAAVERIDNGVIFLGGADARKGKHPGDMVVDADRSGAARPPSTMQRRRRRTR